ncbi:MAG: AAA family ATPase [bacterium]|nr:AAA family ATPase [bacterium]
MYLKSLEINGFKSFSQKAVLHFSPSRDGLCSITGIVGPNGSGKSNVADAVRWVLGEQSMKLLRAKKSEDLIFSGSEAKGKMSMAAVTMIIDNSDGKLPIDYSELVITRRLYREGDNEYIINGHKIRLLDLQLLLAKAQFGQGSYSVIGQGMIDRMLLQTPSERKDFFDEAFGIKEFQIKRHQAVLKLKHTRENMDQAEALLDEVSPRLKSLSRQIKKLEERQEVELQLRELQESYYLTLWSHNEAQLKELKKELFSIEQKYNENYKKLNAVQVELSGLAKETSREDEYKKLQDEYQEVIQQKNNLEREKATLSGRMQVEYSKEGRHNVGWIENKVTSLKDSLSNLQNEIDGDQEKIKGFREFQSQYRNNLDSLTIERAELKSRLSSLETQFTQIKSEQNFFQATGLKSVQAILDQKQKFGKIFGALAQLGEVKEKYQVALDTAAGGHLSSLVVADDMTAEECIKFLRNEHLGVATFLPVNRIKPRILPQNIEGMLQIEGVHGVAINLIKFSERLSNIFSYVLGTTLVVEDIDVARVVGIGKIRMVTLEGDILDVSGSMKGGYRRYKSSSLSFACSQSLSRIDNSINDQTGAIEEVRAKLEKTEIEYEKLNSELISINSEVEVGDKKLSFLRIQKTDKSQEIASLEQELKLHTMSKEEYGTALDTIRVQKDGVLKSIENLSVSLLSAESKIKSFHQEEERKKKLIFELQDSMQQFQEELNKIVTQKNEKQISVAKLDTRQEDLSSEVYQELSTSVESILKKTGASIETDAIESTLAQIQKLKYKLTLVGGIDEEVVGEYEETRKRHEDLSTQLDDLNKAYDDLEGLVGELDSLMKVRRDKSFKKIKKEFQRYFKLLFDGGAADLIEIMGNEDETEGDENVIIESEELIEIKEPKKRRRKILQGMEITACPPGKKIKDIQALSGGERTLTSIALICAILSVNPPPFSVLDEVEAALDEANTLRFNMILNELSGQTQFVLITHNRVTMHAASTLYGVTMGGAGVSHLVSVKLGNEEYSTGDSLDV